MATTRREFLQSVAPSHSGKATQTAKPAPVPGTSALPAPSAIALLTSRCSYGLTQAEYGQASSLGSSAWLSQQLAYASLDDSALQAEIAASYPRVNQSVTDLLVEARALSDGGSNAAREHVRATLLRRIKSKRQLYEVMVEFWTNHFNIHNGSSPLRIYKLIDDREVIRVHALGNFGALLKATAHSPAMLEYLENFNNVAGVAQENYARELMELHTLGVDGGYTEADVKDVARCFTGWSIRKVVADTPQFYFYQSRHDTGAKLVLGNAVPAGRGVEDGDQVLDILFNHPSTAHNIARKLCTHFIGDSPESTAVDAVAATYKSSNGDIPAMLRTLFSRAEFLASYDRKVRRPGSLLPASLRVVGASLTGDYQPTLSSRLKLLGNVPYLWLAPDGYPDSIDYWINTGSSLNRWNWMLALAEGKAYSGISVDIPGLIGTATTPKQLVDALATRVLRRSLSSTDRTTLINYAAAGGNANTPLAAATLLQTGKELLGMMLSSAYFQYR